MNELTLLQKAMRIVEEHEPSLFDVHTNKGRDFICAMSELIKEKLQSERQLELDIMNDLIEVSNTVIWVEEKGGEQ